MGEILFDVPILYPSDDANVSHHTLGYGFVKRTRARPRGGGAAHFEGERLSEILSAVLGGIYFQTT